MKRKTLFINMVLILTEFWDNENINPHQLTDEMIEVAENKLQVKLPKLFLELLKVQNGGNTKGFVFLMNQQTSWSENHIPFDEMFGIFIDDTDISRLSILDTEYLTKEWDLPKRQVLLCGDGHWWITLDYRKSTKPTVRWIDVECNEDIHISDSFEEFINGLILEDEFDYEIK